MAERVLGTVPGTGTGTEPRVEPCPHCGTQWLIVERVTEVYGYPKSTVYKLASRVKSSKPELLGLHLHQASIEAYIEKFAKDPDGLAQDVQGESPETKSDVSKE